MSWESTSHYYRLINQAVNKRLGGLHSAQIIMSSIDFQPLEILMHQGKWKECGRCLSVHAKKIEDAGADFLVICTNTMHMVAAEVSGAISIPLLHIADAAAAAVKERGMRTIGLLGTRFTMEENFYVDRLLKNHGLCVLIPEPEDRQIVHDVIFEELCRGQVREASRKNYLRIIDQMGAQGAEAVIAGCTEIGMLINQGQTSLPLFDTTELHAEHAARLAFS